MSVSSANSEQITADSRRKPTLRHLLEETDRFLVAVELVTSRGLLSDQEDSGLGPRALSAESPGSTSSPSRQSAGNAMLAADTLGTDLMSHGQK